jgi:lipopolysaccharide transport system ATP-binding protein
MTILIIRFKGTIWALKDVSFEVRPGEVLGLIGPNGAGKTTTLSLLAGITSPTNGLINVNGRVGALIQLGAGFHHELTGRENIYLNGVIMGLSRRKISQIIDEIIHFAELEKFIDTPIKRYSSGMYVRLGFSVAIHIDPEILLIDEVLAVGDASFKAKCYTKIRNLESGITVVLVSFN